MDNFNDFFNPVSLNYPEDYYNSNENSFGKSIHINTPDTPIDDISNYRIAILGVEEDRNSANIGSAKAPNIIRNRLYQLFKIDTKHKIIDLGNLKIGKTFTDTYIILKEVIEELNRNRVVTIIIGGTQDLTFPCYLGIETNISNVTLTTIDSEINFLKNPYNNYLLKIFERKKIFNYVNLGNQIYLCDPESMKYLESKTYDAIRLGIIRQKIDYIEPILRDSDIVSFDIGAIKQSEAPAKKYGSPNGFTSEEACLVARYAGLSNKVECFGLFEINPTYDINYQTSRLGAQILWHFIEGVCNRIKENPENFLYSKNFKSFIVNHENLDHSITFIKSELTGNWWMEVPDIKNSKNIYISCSHEDYLSACNGEIPDLWVKYFNKIN